MKTHGYILVKINWIQEVMKHVLQLFGALYIYTLHIAQSVHLFNLFLLKFRCTKISLKNVSVWPANNVCIPLPLYWDFPTGDRYHHYLRHSKWHIYLRARLQFWFACLMLIKFKLGLLGNIYVSSLLETPVVIPMLL